VDITLEHSAQVGPRSVMLSIEAIPTTIPYASQPVTHTIYALHATPNRKTGNFGRIKGIRMIEEMSRGTIESGKTARLLQSHPWRPWKICSRLLRQIPTETPKP
jgi:hypothetical protein